MRTWYCIAVFGFLGTSLPAVAMPVMNEGQAEETDDDLQYLAEWEENIHRGQLKDARDSLEEYLFDLPDSARAHVLYAEVMGRRGDYDVALEHLETARELAGPQGVLADWARVSSQALKAVGRAKDSLEALEAGLREDPENASLLSRKIELLAETGRRADAKKLLNALPAVRVDGDGDPFLLTEHARAYLAVGNLDRAVNSARYAEKIFEVRKDAVQAAALQVLGDIYRAGRTGDGLAALDAYRAALAIDRSLAGCYVGIAQTYLYRMDVDKAEEAIQSAFRWNPRLPDAFAVQAEIFYTDRKFSEGLEASEKGLKLNANHRGLLACRAAGAVLLGRDDAEEAIQAMLGVDPMYADGFRLIGGLVAHHNRFEESIPFFERGIEVDPEWPLTYVGLARSLGNLGLPDAAVEALREFRKRDPYRYPLADNCQDSMKVVQGLVEASTGPFRFYMDPLDRPVLGPLLTRLYEQKWPDFQERYGLGDVGRIRVEVFSEHDDFSARSVGFTGFGALGVCFGNTFTLVSPRAELMRGSFHWERTAVHELAHVVSLHLSRHRVPRWLTEGMSVYEEGVFKDYCEREMDLELYNYFHSDEILPVRGLNRIFGGPKVIFGYYQSGLLCRYLVENHGQEMLVRLLGEYAKDLETPEVVQALLGITPEELDQRFLDWLVETRLGAMKVQPTYTPHGRRRLLDRVAESEDPPAELLAQVAWAYHAARKAVDRDDYIAQALAKDPDTPAIQFLLAELAGAKGNLATQKQKLERGFEAGGEEFFAFLQRAEIARGEKDFDLALEFYARAKQCFPRYVGMGNPYIMRGHLLDQLEREDEALEEWRQYCTIDEKDSTSRRLLVERALDRDDFEEAAKYLIELRSIDPFHRELHKQLARCQRELSKPSEAIRSLEIALAVDPMTEATYDPELPEEVRVSADREQRIEILLELADLYRDLGEIEEARRRIEACRELGADAERLEAFESW